MKIAVIGNQARAMVNFWSVFIRCMVAAGHDVVCCVPDADNEWAGRLRELGARVCAYPLERKGLNPLQDLKTLWALRALLRREKPDKLFAYTIKPVIYGSLAAFFAGTPARVDRSVMITGLGYMFEADTPVKRLLTQAARLLYRLALGCVSLVFFQNKDDRACFSSLGIIPDSTRVAMSAGTGVDSGYFALKALPQGPVHFMFVGRLLQAKGIVEFYHAAKALKSEYPTVRCSLLGPAEKGPGSIAPETVSVWQREGILEYLGETADVRPFMESAHVLVLPSYREGLPTVVMEAMSMGRPAIVTDVPGCREIVEHEKNGLLVPVRDAQALATAMKRLVEDPGSIARMGQEGRRKVETSFDAALVAGHIMAAMAIGCKEQM